MKRMQIPAEHLPAEESCRVVVDASSVQGPSSSQGYQKASPPTCKASTQHSITNLINCILSAAILSYPYCFKSCGFLLSLLLMAFSYWVTRVSYQFMLYSNQLSNSSKSFEELAEQACGKTGRLIIDLCTFSVNMGCLIAYLNMLADVLSSVAGTIIPPGAEPSRNAYLIGVTIAGAFPVAMIVRDHTLMTSFSKASVIFMSIFAAVIIVFALSPEESVTAPVSGVSEGTLEWWNVEGLLVAFPMITYSFTGHPYYMGIYNNLRSANIPRMLYVTDMAMGAIALLYASVGIAGYITFKDRTAGDLLRNIGAPGLVGIRGVYERSVKLCYGLSILVSIPIVVLPFYNIILPLLGYDLNPPPPSIRRLSSDAGSDTGLDSSILSPTSPPSLPTPVPAPKLGSRGSRLPAEGRPSTAHTSNGVCEGGSSAHSSDECGYVRGRSHSPNGVCTSRKMQSASSSTVLQQELDVIDLKLQHDGVHTGLSTSSGDIYSMIDLQQHTLVVLLVLGGAMAAAIWVPNVEFIFGISGSTASVLMGFVMPPLIFIRILDNSPEMAPSKNNIIPPEVRSKWKWRRRLAVGLLIFGIVSGVVCTDAILAEVWEEAAVVQLAQQLLAQEIMVQGSSRAQARAKEAVESVDLVETASKQLDDELAGTGLTMGTLQAAADALSSIANDKRKAAKHGKNAWDLSSSTQDNKQRASDSKVLTSVEKLLEDVITDVSRTQSSVQAVVAQLNSTIAKLKAEAAAATAEDDPKQSEGGGGSDGSTVVVSAAPQKAAHLASELGKALGIFSAVAPNVTTGKSLEQVRSSAMAASAALNQTRQILNDVKRAVAKAKKKKKHAAEIKEAAVKAMQAALNATATSSLALKLVTEALDQSAGDEADELLTMLTKVATDLQNKKKKSSGDEMEITAGMGSDIKALEKVGSSSMTMSNLTVPGATLAGAPPAPSSLTSSTDADKPSNGTITTPSSSSSYNKTLSALNKERVKAMKKVIESLKALTAETAEVEDGGSGGSDGPNHVSTRPSETSTEKYNITATASAMAAAALEAAEHAEDLKGVSAVLKEAMQWTQGSQNSVIRGLNTTLSKANSKVQSRVFGILKDISDSSKKDKQGTAVEEAQDPKELEGPVVIMTKGGALVQRDSSEDGTTGPIVSDDKDRALTVPLFAGGQVTRVGEQVSREQVSRKQVSREQVSREQKEKVNRKVGMSGQSGG